MYRDGGLAQMVERSLSMREAAGSIPASSRNGQLCFCPTSSCCCCYLIAPHVLVAAIILLPLTFLLLLSLSATRYQVCNTARVNVTETRRVIARALIDREAHLRWRRQLRGAVGECHIDRQRAQPNVRESCCRLELRCAHWCDNQCCRFSCVSS